MTRAASISLLFLSSQCLAQENLGDWVGSHIGELVSTYQEFHRHPELSFEEKETAARLASALKSAGLEVTTDFGGHGVVGIFKNGAGPTVMLRTDLDALPVTEQTGLVYASKVRTKDGDGNDVGVMHACGHDIHITCIIGVTQYLMANRGKWSGTLMVIGQPAEERVRGAAKMLDAGLFTRFPKPDYALAIHVDSSLATGKLGYRAGYLWANVDTIDIIMKGRGGHGAYPHATIDPVVMAAQLVLDLQTLVSREIKPTEPAVVTVGSIHGGTKHNIIGDTCRLQLTVRSFSDDVRSKLLEGIQRKAKAVAAGAGAPDPEVIHSDESNPALKNDAALVNRLIPVWQRVLGEENVLESEPTMGGEDFALYGRAGVPICMFRLGAVEPKRLAGLTRGGMSPPSLHSPQFYPDAEEAISTGVVAMSASTLELFKPGSGSEKSE
jgi:hippurate hydrolase